MRKLLLLLPIIALLQSCDVVYAQKVSGRTVTATQALISDTLRANTNTVNLASAIKALGTFDFQKSGVFRQPVTFQDTTVITNVGTFYPLYLKIRKNILLFESAADSSSPTLYFKQSANGGTIFDSAGVSFDEQWGGVKAIKLSAPLEFGDWTTNKLGPITRVIGISGDTLWAKGASGNIIRIALVPGTAGQALGLINTTTYAPISIAGGGGGTGNGIKLRLDDLSVTIYPDTMATLRKRNFLLATGAGKEGIIDLVQNIGATDTNAFNLTTLAQLRLKNATSNYAAFNFASGPANINVTVPNLGGGTYTMAFLNGGLAFTDALWHATPIELAYYTHIDRSMSIDTLNSHYTNKHLTRFWTFDSGLSTKSITVQDPTFTGSTLINQQTNNQLAITNTAGLWLDMPLIKFLNSGSMPFSGILAVQNFSGNRSWLLPDRSGTLVSSATAPLAIDAVSGNISVTGTFLTSLNGLTTASQTFAVGTAGTAFNIVSSGSTHTFNLPSAGLGITAGLVTNSTQSISGQKTTIDPFTTTAVNAGPVTVNGPTYNLDAQGETFRCDPTGNGGSDIVVQLPTVTGRSGRRYTFYKEMVIPDSHVITLVPNGLELINGGGSVVLTDNFDNVTFTTDGIPAHGWVIIHKRIGGELIPGVALIQASTDSAWVPIAGFDSTQSWAGAATYVDSRQSQVPLPTPQLIFHPGGFGIKANYDWTIDNVRLSFLYKLKQ